MPAQRNEDLRKLAEAAKYKTWWRMLERETSKYGITDKPKLVARSEFTPADQDLVETIGHDILRLYASRYTDALKP